jgi:predicted O-methyltransferase YrrM
MITSSIENSILTMDGWCSPEKAREMMLLIEKHKPNIIVEIGVFGGRSIVAAGDACRQLGAGHVYGIDPWSSQSSVENVDEQANIEWWSKLDYEEIYLRCMKNIQVLELDRFVTILRTNSDRASVLFGNQTIDLLHIDGNHSEPVSSRDVLLYVPLVRESGFVLFDDMDWRSTQNAVRILRETCDQVDSIGNCGLFKKRTAR